jgi:hypothetical protein
VSDNWVVQNLQKALNVWNDKLSEIWQLVTQSPQDFRGGAIWAVVENVHGVLLAIGYALLVLFFAMGVVKTCASFAEIKKPEHAAKLFVRFALAKGAIIVLACMIFSVFASSPPTVDADAAAASMVWSYIGECVFNMLILVGTVKMADRVVHEMMGL